VNPKDKAAINRVDLSVLPPEPLAEIALSLMEGELKDYGERNWIDNPIKLRTYYAACLRHLFRWLDGEDVDADTGLFHLGSAAASLIIMMDAIANGSFHDDRKQLDKSFKKDWMKNINNKLKELREGIESRRANRDNSNESN